MRVECPVPLGWLGSAVGCVGERLGSAVGCVGAALGSAVGCVGAALGSAVGCVGAALGSAVGRFFLFSMLSSQASIFDNAFEAVSEVYGASLDRL